MQPFSPVITDKDTAGFFAAAAEHRLVVRSCEACGEAIHPPTAHCPACGSWNTGWRDVSGRGQLYSWTTVWHQVHPAYPVPYTITVVELQDVPGVRFVGRLSGEPQLKAGMPMSVFFETTGDGAVLPNWQLTSGEAMQS